MDKEENDETIYTPGFIWSVGMSLSSHNYKDRGTRVFREVVVVVAPRRSTKSASKTSCQQKSIAEKNARTMLTKFGVGFGCRLARKIGSCKVASLARA